MRAAVKRISLNTVIPELVLHAVIPGCARYPVKRVSPCGRRLNRLDSGSRRNDDRGNDDSLLYWNDEGGDGDSLLRRIDDQWQRGNESHSLHTVIPGCARYPVKRVSPCGRRSNRLDSGLRRNDDRGNGDVLLRRDDDPLQYGNEAHSLHAVIPELVPVSSETIVRLNGGLHPFRIA